MNSIAILQSRNLCGREFTFYGTKEEPLFLAKEVAGILQHSQPDVLVKMVDDDEKLTLTMFSSGQNRQMWFLTEDGLYEVLMQSRKPIAKEFKKGVKKILKEIRTQGGYIATSAEDTPELIMARALQVAQQTIINHQQRVQMLEGQNKVYEEQIKELAPKASYTDQVLQSTSTYTHTQMAKELNFRSVATFLNHLQEIKMIYKQSGQWQLKAKYSGYGYTTTRTAKFFHTDGTPGSTISTVWTEKGRQFLHNTLKIKQS